MKTLKKAEEYLKFKHITREDPEIDYDFWIDIIKQAQIDAIEVAVERCAIEAELELRDYSQTPMKVSNLGQEIASSFEHECLYYGVDIQSILKIADKLKGEIEND